MSGNFQEILNSALATLTRLRPKACFTGRKSNKLGDWGFKLNSFFLLLSLTKEFNNFFATTESAILAMDVC